MTIPLKVVDRGGLLHAALAEHVWKRTQNLAHGHAGVKQCRVSVDGPGQHSLPDRVRIRIYVTIEGSEIAVTHQGGADMAIAIREAFDAADRRLENATRLGRQALRTSKRRTKRIS
jgi:hypothetical protein